MGKKFIAKRALREKIHKLLGYPRPSTRSQDTTFTPSPSPPISPPRTALMAWTKTTPHFSAPAKPTPPPKAAPTKPTSSKPSSSKGKRPAVKTLFLRQQNLSQGLFLCVHKEVTLNSLSNLLENPTLILLLTNHIS
ncbi:uncharacterized protein DS421_2g55570 [Arachis hypogaea]|nr:uncharacterized protein DS421_2g55570 [Arachis hypogaea]